MAQSKHHGHSRKVSLAGAAGFALAASMSTASAAATTTSQEIFDDLGMSDAGAALEVLYNSGTLTKEKLWENIKRSKIKNAELVWKHQVTVLQEKVATGNYDEAAKIFFGRSLDSEDLDTSHDLILSPMDAKRLLVAQTQELFGRKEGQERHDAFGVPMDTNISQEHLKSALSKLGLIEEINPNQDADIVIIPGASLVGMLARQIWVADMQKQGIIKPTKIIVTAGDRELSQGLDALDPTVISKVADAFKKGAGFEDIRKTLLSPEAEEKEKVFANFTKKLASDYESEKALYHARIKGFDKWGEFSVLNETGATIYLIKNLGLGNEWEVTHTPKYDDGRRPDTESTGATFAKYFFDELYFEGVKLDVAANQPYSERQAEAYKRALAKEAAERNIDNSSYSVTFSGFAYNHGDAKRPLSEFAALVAEKAKGESLDLSGLWFRGREEISIEDMPSISGEATDAAAADL